MRHRRTLLHRLREGIELSPDRVFLTRELRVLAGGSPGISRILKGMVRDALLVRISHGVYVKTRLSSLTGRIVMAGPLPDTGREALRKLGVRIVPTPFQQALMDCGYTQASTGRVIGVRARLRRRFAHGEHELDLVQVRSRRA